MGHQGVTKSQVPPNNNQLSQSTKKKDKLHLFFFQFKKGVSESDKDKEEELLCQVTSFIRKENIRLVNCDSVCIKALLICQ